MNILLAVDGSPYSKKMLAWLATHQEWLAAPHTYTVVTVVPAIPPHAASMFSSEDLKAHYKASADAVFKPIRTFMAKHKMDTRYVDKVGHAAETIAKLADKEDVDLLMLGSHGHGNFMNLVTGSVATQVLARCKKPVLLVR